MHFYSIEALKVCIGNVSLALHLVFCNQESFLKITFKSDVFCH